MWRPKVINEYIEPDVDESTFNDLEVLYKHYGKSLWKKRHQLPPRDPSDIIEFDPEKHADQLKRNLQWHACPKKYHKQLTTIIKDKWDSFAEEGLRKHIHGFQFHVNTGAAKPVKCKLSHYDPTNPES